MQPPLFTLETLDLVPATNPLKQVYSSNTSGLLAYHGYGAMGTVCHLEVYDGPDMLVAVATEVPQNRGCSITNGSKTVALAVEKVMGLGHVFGSPQTGNKRYALIEHYIEHSYPGRDKSEDFSLIRFLGADGSSDYYTDREWTPITKSELERLIGGPLG